MAGHVRRACEVNFIRSQQREPTESSPLLAMDTSRNPLTLGRGGCQKLQRNDETKRFRIYRLNYLIVV